ncbi:hypothetical protein RRG08_036389 [Elysia crispata]|nr:hypothetical protein RRG08_036389 [Elysia crispata]
MEEERVGERSDTELDNESDVEMTGIEDDSETDTGSEGEMEAGFEPVPAAADDWSAEPANITLQNFVE